MHFKLLLLGQLLAVLSCTQIRAHDEVHSAEATTLPQIVVENEATSLPEEGLQELDEGLAVFNQVTALPETTIKNVETTSPITTTTTTTTTSTTPAATTTTTEAHKKTEVPPAHPLAYPHLHPYPHPYAHPYAHPYPYPNTYPGPASKDTSTPQPETGYPGYPYPNFPILRPPYGSYGAPVYHQRFPSFSPGLGYGLPSHSVDGTTEKSKSDEADDSAKGKSPESTEQAPKLPSEQPSFGYPPVYLIQRRPLLPRYPYASPARGYGSPYGYRR